jgi:hypothetical protein
MTFRSVLAALALAGVLAPLGAAAQPSPPRPVPGPSMPALPTMPSMPAGPLGQTSPLSLQSQLGAIPLLSPRALQQASRVRKVTLTQLSPTGEKLGEHEVDCPESGCQRAMALAVGDRTLPFMADIQFVGRGAYVSLQARAVEIGAVVEFEKGRRGPAFLRGEGEAALAQTLRYALAPSATLRRLDLADDGKTLNTGNVYTRKRTPDLVMRVEIAAPRDAAN